MRAVAVTRLKQIQIGHNGLQVCAEKFINSDCEKENLLLC